MTQLPDIVRCSSFDEFRSFAAKSAKRKTEMDAFEANLLRSNDTFTVPGRCAVCNRHVEFLVDYQWGDTSSDGQRRPNWRERVVCPRCHLNNRMRAALGFLLAEGMWLNRVYLTEATTPLFKLCRRRRPRTIGSEFLRDGTKPGEINANGIRHEDATKLSFADRSFHQIGTFDVLEHIPDYQQALMEFFRCLKPSGRLLITVPFVLDAPSTITRAVMQSDGSIKHLLPPEIHGDPVASEGALCVYHCGWDFLDTLRIVGFEDAGLSFFWSPELGYLGGYQFVITARRPA